jgi:flagellin-like hook-associated protein FlgL
MRIATSTIYNNQASSIDNLSAQYQQIGQSLSTGKSLNVPSDNAAQVSQDLSIRTMIAAEDGDASNATAAANQLTFTDSTLSSLTSLLQTARNLAVSGANDIIPNGAQRPLIGTQVAGLLDQALGLANAQYGSTYLFAGTGSATTPPISPQGSPPNAVQFIGNNDVRTEVINGVKVPVGTTMQQAFNLNSTNGTSSVFTLLATLRDTLTKEPAQIQSAQPINVTGQVIAGAGSAAPTTLAQIAGTGPPVTTPMTTVALKADSLGNYAIHIDGTSPTTGAVGGVTISFPPGTTLDDGTPASVIGLINAQTPTTGVTASWNTASQRIQLASTGPNSPPFMISDAPSTNPGPPPATATTSSNFLEAFQLPKQISVTSNLSTQIGDIDAVINQVLNARANVGQQIQNLSATTSQLQALSVDNTTTKSGYEDTNVAQATSQFTLTQTALQAAYAVTSRLEGKTLIDYI